MTPSSRSYTILALASLLIENIFRTTQPHSYFTLVIKVYQTQNMLDLVLSIYMVFGEMKSQVHIQGLGLAWTCTLGNKNKRPFENRSQF